MSETPSASETVKRSVRAAVRTARRGRSDEDRLRARDGLALRLSELVTAAGARTVTCYAALPDEPDTGGFLEWAAAQDLSVLLPATRPNGAMDWIRAGGGFASGPLGIPEPIGTPATPAELAGIDLMLVPACAVDRSGTRLGWGGGYFDRFLARLDPRPPVHAVVFDEDLLPRLPREIHDVPVDGAVTPERLLRFAGRPG